MSTEMNVWIRVGSIVPPRDVCRDANCARTKKHPESPLGIKTKPTMISQITTYSARFCPHWQKKKTQITVWRI